MASYALFIGVAWVTWEANLRLYLRFQDRTAWLTRPWHRVRLLVGTICLFTIPFTSSALWLWAVLFKDPDATVRAIATAVISIVAIATFITHVYETVFLVKEWESDRARGDLLQTQRVDAELLALRSEVNPHTLFNNLNALSHLVEQGHPSAAAFVSALANSYRYLLRTGSKRLVALLDELAPRVRKSLHADEKKLPLACVLEGGTWAAGRALAQKLRGGQPPLRVASDGTVF